MKRHIELGFLISLVLAASASATMVHQAWYTNVGQSRQAIIDFLEDLVNPVPTPDLEEIIDESLLGQSDKDGFVSKCYGWVTVPATGTYQFHYASDDYGMLYVSRDEDMANAVEVAYLEGYAGVEEWDNFPSQHSKPMQLAAGQVVAVMVVFEDAGGGDHMEIGWTGPGLSEDITAPSYLTDYITHIPPQMTKARNPSPEVGAVDVSRGTNMSWVPGKFAVTHDVYWGTSYDTVSEASRADPLGVLVSQGQSTATYDPGYLEFGQTYYWRVDEVNAVPTTIYKGNIWEFTVEPFAYPVEDVIVTTNGVSDDTAGPENTINGSGLNAADEHSTVATDMWLASPGAEPLYLQYEFDSVIKLHEMLVWNYNVPFEPMLGFGAKDVTVEYSENGTDWLVLGDVELAQATARASYTANNIIAFDGVAARFVRLALNSSYGAMGPIGLSEVRFLFIPVQACEPQPADGDSGVAIDTTLSWSAGREAVSHEVYAGIDPEALALIDTTTSMSCVPGLLDLATTYYWKVDEVNEADEISVWPGRVWNFTTEPFIVIDDFESYDDDENRVYEAWVDGYDAPDNGSTVGHLESPFAETSIVNSGGQAMPLFYDNAGSATSEANLDLSQDWTASGIKTLSLHFYGDLENTGQLYLKINNTKVPYDGDVADIALEAWQTWNVNLSIVGNVSDVTSLTIGIEGAGAAGVMYIDDIRLYHSAPE